MRPDARSRLILPPIALVAAVVFAFPIWFMVTSAFKAEPEIQAIPVHWLCQNPDLRAVLLSPGRFLSRHPRPRPRCRQRTVHFPLRDLVLGPEGQGGWF